MLKSVLMVIYYYIINLLKQFPCSLSMKKQQALSLIIPCYNEEAGIPQLVEQLASVSASLPRKYTLEIIFVDDGSTDKTNELLHQHFASNPAVTVIKHEKNQNLGAALKTGFNNAKGDLIATWDSDCTYPFYLLPEMLKLLDKNTQVVTVSPYHPQGKVENVPAWRIFLSKSSSMMYKFLLNSGIYTHGAMVRVYKKEVLQNVRSGANNFLYVPEILIKAVLKGYKVKEIPATLRVRQFGVSKMKLFNTIKSHLNLMGKVVLYKTFGKEL